MKYLLSLHVNTSDYENKKDIFAVIDHLFVSDSTSTE